MSHVRIEFVPVQHARLGWLGFHHLQLVFVETGQETAPVQDDWYVLEGDCGCSDTGRILGVLGAGGRLRLAAANLASGADLVAKIGTPQLRGSRLVSVEGQTAWPRMVEYAQQINASGFRYRACGAPCTPFAPVTSSSVVASLLWRIGIDVNQVLPYGLVRSPGLRTLLGTTGSDTLFMPPGFDTIIGGDGNDEISGSNDPSQVDRLMGGAGNDVIRSSSGFNINHGGDPSIAYADDGIDTIVYGHPGRLTVSPNRYAIPNLSPEFIATFEGARTAATDWLYSIERVELAGSGSRLVLAPGSKRMSANLAIEMGGAADFSQAGTSVCVLPSGDDEVCVQLRGEGGSKSWWVRGAHTVTGSRYDDEITLAGTMRRADGGAGNDTIDARAVRPASEQHGSDFDCELNGGDGDDILISGLGRTLAYGGDGHDTFVLGALSDTDHRTELVIADATPGDRLLVPMNFFDGTISGSQGSHLIPLNGAAADWEAMETAPAPFVPGDEGRLDATTQTTSTAQAFCGEISYFREAGDVVIHVVPGRRRDALDGPVLDFERETLIRVQHYSPNCLGLTFRAGETHPIRTCGTLGLVASVACSTGTQGPANASEDTLFGTPGCVMAGGAGDDVYYVNHSGDVVVEQAGEGVDKVIASIDYTLPDHVEDLTLTGQARVGTGNGADNVIIGNDGDNVLDGGEGDDTLYGAGGNDVLIGGAGSDAYVVTQGSGDKRIIDEGPASDVDQLILAGGITPADVTSYRLANAPDDLVLAFAAGGSVTIENQCTGAGIEIVRFDDQTVWTRAQLVALEAPVWDDVPARVSGII